ncbi:hypothetical protein ACFQZE_07185 [Paenibacillus sp. GCM10027627]
MKTKEQLIAYYEKQLEKVIDTYKNDHNKIEYIKHAEEQLEAVKNGRQW